MLINAPLELGRAREEEVIRLVSLNEVQPVLSQICDYRPLSVNPHTLLAVTLIQA